MGNVGDARDFYAAHCKLPRARVGHYVAVVEDLGGDLAAISTCCDGVDDSVRMLRVALFALTHKVALVPDSEAVIVGRDDLRAVLSVLADSIPAGILRRFREALGETPGETTAEDGNGS